MHRMNLLSLGIQRWLVLGGPYLLFPFSQELWVNKNAGSLSLKFWSYRFRKAQATYIIQWEKKFTIPHITLDIWSIMANEDLKIEERLCFHIRVLINFTPHLLDLLSTEEANTAVILRIIYWLHWKRTHLLCNLTWHFQQLAFKHIVRGFFTANEGESASDEEQFICFHFIQHQCSWNIFASEHDSYLSFSLASFYSNFFLLL